MVNLATTLPRSDPLVKDPPFPIFNEDAYRFENVVFKPLFNLQTKISLGFFPTQAGASRRSSFPGHVDQPEVGAQQRGPNFVQNEIEVVGDSHVAITSEKSAMLRLRPEIESRGRQKLR